MNMWPCWVLGMMMLLLVINSTYKNLIKVDFKAIFKFLRWMLFLTAIRVIVFKLAMPAKMIEELRQMAGFIPWQTTLGVFWEDACYGLPLVLMEKMYNKSSWYKFVRIPLLAMFMMSFGSGHIYQGLTGLLLAFYIPFSISMGKKYGFGTVMLCHIMYDMITLLSMKIILGS